MESKLHSASNKIRQEQCTLGVEGEGELINENEDKIAKFQWRMKHLVKIIAHIHHKMRT